MNNNPYINVSSYFQSGGITAHTVNLGAPPRHLDSASQAQLKSKLPTGTKVKIMCAWGDQEAFQFASETREFLIAKGYEVGNVIHSMFNKPVFGQHAEKTADGHTLIIGTNN